MKTTNKNTATAPFIRSDILSNTNQSDRIIMIDCIKATMHNTTFYNRLASSFKNTFILSNSVFSEDKFEDCRKKYTPLSSSDGAKVRLLGDIVSSKLKIIDILSDNFKNKYTTPFLLYSLGYKYEEIASVLVLPVSIVKSRIFYVQKKMQLLLTDSNLR